MTWKLSSSQIDRIEYDRVAREAGKASAQVLSDEDLEKVDAQQVAREVFEADLQAGLIDVDDIEEARARFVPAFVEGYLDEKKERHTDGTI